MEIARFSQQTHSKISSSKSRIRKKNLKMPIVGPVISLMVRTAIIPYVRRNEAILAAQRLGLTRHAEKTLTAAKNAKMARRFAKPVVGAKGVDSQRKK